MVSNLPRGIVADHDGDMPFFTPVTYDVVAVSKKYRRKVKRGPGRGRVVRMKVVISRTTHFLPLDLHQEWL